MTSPAASPSTPVARPASRVLHVSLWVVQVLLGAMFTMAGVMKSSTAIAELATKVPWVTEVPMWMVRFIGISELAGGIGLIVPALTRIRPGLTALAGLGLAVVMVLAAGYHVMHGELQALPINFVLGGLAAFVAWGRFRKAPIAPRA